MSRNWWCEVADLVVGLIVRANYGRRPDSIEDWREICNRYDVLLVITDAPTRQTGCQMDDTITVARSTSCRKTCARIAHELAEFLVTTEVEAPYNYRPCAGVSYDEERHAIARAVERRLGLAGVGPGRRPSREESRVGKVLPQKLQRYCVSRKRSQTGILRSEAVGAW